MGMLSTAPTSKTLTDVDHLTVTSQQQTPSSTTYGYSPVFATRYVGSYEGVTPLCMHRTRIDLFRNSELMWQCSDQPDQWQSGTWQTNTQGRSIRLHASQVFDLKSDQQSLVGQTVQGQVIHMSATTSTGF